MGPSPTPPRTPLTRGARRAKPKNFIPIMLRVSLKLVMIKSDAQYLLAIDQRTTEFVERVASCAASPSPTVSENGRKTLSFNTKFSENLL